MTDATERRTVIPGEALRHVAAPVVVECADAAHGGDTMTVIPLVRGDRVEGFEVRCQCGSSVVVECIYEPVPE